jgi:CheY-like chemotaxis protein
MSASNGPILIIEDDPDDQAIIRECLQELKVANTLIPFMDCEEAFNFLMSTREKPFLILCDVNMPGMNGTELRRKICETDYLKKKSIPFVFLTTTARQQAVEDAYHLSVQGYFEKPNRFEQLKERLSLIMRYWKECLHPNSF